MSLQNWLNERRLRPHQSSPQEIGDLLRVVDRDLTDAEIKALSIDRRFTNANNAVLQLATMVLRASGYRTAGTGHHWITFLAIPHLMGPDQQNRADYFDSCRQKRNLADYDVADAIAETEVVELYGEAWEFRQEVLE